MYKPDFLPVAEETRLLEEIGRVEFSEVRFHGFAAIRTVAHFGVDYAYDSRRIARKGPLPPWLGPLCNRCAALAGVEPDSFVEALVTRYPAGAAIGWHRDAPAFGDAVAGVSLGAACRLRFRRNLSGTRQTYALELEPRSAYVMSGPARWSWEHSIPGVPALRHSITFRSLRSTTGPRRDRPE